MSKDKKAGGTQGPSGTVIPAGDNSGSDGVIGPARNPSGFPPAPSADLARQNKEAAERVKLEQTTPHFSDPGPQISQTAPPLPNGTPEAAPKKRRQMSTPLQIMARIETAMEDLDEKQRAIVFAWFAATYRPLNSSMSVSTEGKS